MLAALWTMRAEERSCDAKIASSFGIPLRMMRSYSLSVTVGQKTVPMFGCFAKIEVEQIYFNLCKTAKHWDSFLTHCNR